MALMHPWRRWFLTLCVLASCATQARAEGMDWAATLDAGQKAQREGKPAEAEKFFIVALKMAEAPGATGASVADSLNNLGYFYKSRSQYDRAEPLYERLLAIQKKVMGVDHPEVATTSGILAGMYHAQTKYDRAEPL